MIEEFSGRIKIARVLMVMTCLLGWVTTAAPHAIHPTFKIGDAAPVIQPISWLQGNPIERYVSGRVYVVEFWATWCPPCLKAIPHLSALQDKYSDTLTIVGVNAESLLGHEGNVAKVREFMKQHGKEMRYTVALEDPIEKMISERWITATGSLGAPTAGIVDQKGKLVWIGYPDVDKGYTIEQALDDTIAGKTDLARARALQLKTSRETAKYWAKAQKSS